MNENPDGQVSIARHGDVLEVVLDRPHRRNALNRALWQGIEAALARAEREPGLRALTLRGSGGWFSVGGDLDALATGTSHATGSPRHVIDLLEHEQAVVRRLVALPVLTVALIEGAAAGGGFDLALACDLRVATPDAKLAASFVRRGLVPDLGGPYLLRRAVPYPVAARIALTGEVVRGAAALELGLVQAVGEDVAEAARPFLDAVAHAKPYALGRCKSALVRPDVLAGIAQSAELSATQAALLGENEFRDGLAEFLASRDAGRSGGNRGPGGDQQVE